MGGNNQGIFLCTAGVAAGCFFQGRIAPGIRHRQRKLQGRNFQLANPAKPVCLHKGHPAVLIHRKRLRLLLHSSQLFFIGLQGRLHRSFGTAAVPDIIRGDPHCSCCQKDPKPHQSLGTVFFFSTDPPSKKQQYGSYCGKCQNRPAQLSCLGQLLRCFLLQSDLGCNDDLCLFRRFFYLRRSGLLGFFRRIYRIRNPFGLGIHRHVI